jgi:hypothetical protein
MDRCSGPTFAVFKACSLKIGKDRSQMRGLSAGLLMLRRRRLGVEVCLVHPGGPLWREKDFCKCRNEKT